ncbi:MAG TPA: hypothetical protein PLL88_03445 [Anaerolineaceae bacterium]|nr:hypothetical protein [Anaerolineaceae bacterium]
MKLIILDQEAVPPLPKRRRTRLWMAECDQWNGRKYAEPIGEDHLDIMKAKSQGANRVAPWRGQLGSCEL